LLKKPDLGMTINGCLAGLVGITAGCAFVGVGSSAIIGLIAGVMVVPAVIFFDKVHVDDPVGATAVHLINGVFGTLCVGLFSEDWVSPNTTGNGLFFGGGAKLLTAQLTGVGAVAIFTLITSALAWILIKSTIGLRVTLAEEIEGLDIGEHGNIAYPEFHTRKPSYSFVGAGTEPVSASKSTKSERSLKEVHS
jgi:ammonium transporter, Amt family